jgi:molecular chaperone GrpE
VELNESTQENNHENNKDITETNDVEQLKKALSEEKAKAEANLAGWQRAQADFVNYKRYAEQDKTENCKFANIGLLSSILPALDDFERALNAIPSEAVNEKWVEGFELIRKKFKDVLTRQGVTQIQALGMEFDCRTMEAITCVPGKKDMVVQELEKGYKLHDKVIRPAKVIVGNGEEANKEG